MNINLFVGWFGLIIGGVGLFGYGMLLGGRSVPWFGKLEPMRQRFGQVPGTLLHFIAYVVMPLAVGFVFLNKV